MGIAENRFVGLFVFSILMAILGGCHFLDGEDNSDAAPANTVAYVVRENDWSIWTTRDFKNVLKLTGGSIDDAPAWGTGKKEIFFQRNYPGSTGFRIWKMKWNGQGQTPITPVGMNCQSPCPSPDGQHIAFICQHRYLSSGLSRYDICIVHPDGSDWAVLTDSIRFPLDTFRFFGRPTWSHDASALGVFFSYRTQPGIFYYGTIDVTSGHLVVLSELDSMNVENPVWSPTRDEVIYVGGYNLSIFRFNTDGSGLKELEGPQNYDVDWSPDGDRIIYTHFDTSPSQSSFWIMNRDGTNKHVVMAYSGTIISAPSWK
ncbi:MAG: hypothetical protein M1469_05255 [Bacteroidetes bacterium]|nr:hypothetical protein [Bacteroidota bacterium]